jgi:hypothetical protein
MSEHYVTVEFRGICTHFRNAVPGVPHRVVLPLTTSWRPGGFVTPDIPTPQDYLLPPHFPYIYCKEAEQGQRHLLNAPGISNSYIEVGLRLQIANAIGESLDYTQTFEDGIPRVADYAVNYRFSNSVVTGGRAACYFDVFRGEVDTVLHGDAYRTAITIQTDGPPRLQITLMDRQRQQGESVVEIPIEPYLVVGNSGIGCSDPNIDFLWHLVTSDASIPEGLPQSPYGFGGLTDCPQADHTEMFAKLRELGYPGRLTIDPGIELFFETEASCSNSQYP